MYKKGVPQLKILKKHVKWKCYLINLTGIVVRTDLWVRWEWDESLWTKPSVVDVDLSGGTLGWVQITVEEVPWKESREVRGSERDQVLWVAIKVTEYNKKG